MALRFADRILETSTTTGTGAFTLAGAITGYRRFADIPSIATSDTVYYCIFAVDGNGNPSGDWETGLGTYSSANTLTRTTPMASTNAGAAVNFGAGTKYVMVTPVAGMQPSAFAITLLDDANASAARATLGAAGTSQAGEHLAGFIASPSDKSYTLVLKASHAGTITETTTKSVSGTCTATFKINSTALGGTANSVSSSETSQSHASNNVFSAGDDIVLTVSSNSSCADMSFTIKYTRTLD